MRGERANAEVVAGCDQVQETLGCGRLRLRHLAYAFEISLQSPDVEQE